jgi:iron complex outermembrane recepter protein
VIPISRVERFPLGRLAALALAWQLVMPAVGPATAHAQQPAQTGTVSGTVADDRGGPISGAQVSAAGTPVTAQTQDNGAYVLERIPAGTHMIRVRMLGFGPDSASVTLAEGETATHDFTLRRNPLQLQTMVVTGTQTPRINLDASVAVTSLTPADIERASPRSTTEMLRYVPGFTRVESSGGEVNENIAMRGILGVEYVMFMEDGMPVFPTMHTFFMNADNLFRADENIERMEVVRGGASSLFGSNTPGAIINFINKTGGDHLAGTMRASAATEGLARYDLNVNGPLGRDWRFNVGGFYRYDHGVRDPGYPGIRGGQVKASVTRNLSNGYIRLTGKVIDDRNQFILDLPFENAKDPTFVSGFGDYGSMNTNEGLDLRVPIPTGDLTLPLDNGLKTSAGWFTADAAFDLEDGWHIQNTAQAMRNQQEWNALVPSSAMTVQDFLTLPKGQAGRELPAGSTVQLTFTNHFTADTTGAPPLPFDTPNGLVAPGQDIHVSKPISAFQDQFQIRKTLGRHTLSAGAYFANYSQDNHWYFTQILTDVRDNPRLLDAVVTTPGGTPTAITQNGFLNYLSGYTNGRGQTSVFSGVVGGEIQLTEKLRADLGARVEYNNFVQSSEKTATVDLDNNPATTFNNETFGNNSFRHFTKNLTDWAGSIGLNYTLKNNLSLYASGSRGYKMPALDEFLNATAAAQVDLFDSREVQSVEGGIKGVTGRFGFTLNGFFTKLTNIVSQGLVVDSVTGGSTWIIVTSPENRSYGAELELVVNPLEGLQLFANSTILKAELGTGAGADIGSRINGVPTSLANISGVYSVPRTGLQFKADWHWVDSRPVDQTLGISLPAYNYFNFGAGYALPNTGTRINVDLLNAFQGKGLEEGNPRLLSVGGNPIFLARPILPRRFMVSVTYDFGGAQ